MSNRMCKHCHLHILLKMCANYSFNQKAGLGWATYVTQRIPLAIYFTYGNRYYYHATIPAPPPPTASTSLLSLSASPLLPCKEVHHYHLSRFHMHELTYSICLSLSDLTSGRWEGASGHRGHMYTYGWFMLIYGRNQLNIVKQSLFNFLKMKKIT